MLKDQEAIELIREEVDRSYQPIVMSSFGKDSMVMLDLVSRAGFELPILFFREALCPEKYLFAEKIIQDRQYRVFTYPPLRTGVVKRNGNLDIARLMQAGDGYIIARAGIIKPKNYDNALCGLTDFLQVPTGTFSFPWDTILIGTKASDVDMVYGQLQLRKSKATSHGLKFVFPIIDFTDDDIWKYHRDHKVPIHVSRYDENGKDREDSRFNPDKFEACTRCLDQDNGPRVVCPLTNKEIENLADIVPNFSDIELPTYTEKQDG